MACFWRNVQRVVLCPILFLVRVQHFLVLGQLKPKSDLGFVRMLVRMTFAYLFKSGSLRKLIITRYKAIAFDFRVLTSKDYANFSDTCAE